jgi:ketosteroid isomerase-like protein
MYTGRALSAYIGLIALSVACNGSATTDTHDADIKAVKDLEVAWSRDMASKDVDKMSSYWAEDAAVMMPNEPLLSGRQKAKESLTAMVADPNFSLSFQNTRADASKGGDVVYTVGTYSMTISDKDKKPVTDKGKYLTVYKKQADGSWKAVADMINSDMPPPGAPPQ